MTILKNVLLFPSSIHARNCPPHPCSHYLLDYLELFGISRQTKIHPNAVRTRQEPLGPSAAGDSTNTTALMMRPSPSSFRYQRSVSRMQSDPYHELRVFGITSLNTEYLPPALPPSIKASSFCVQRHLAVMRFKSRAIEIQLVGYFFRERTNGLPCIRLQCYRVNIVIVLTTASIVLF